MGEVWSAIRFSAPTDIDYKILKMYATKWFDDEENWPVEEYKDAERTICLETVLADENEVLDFAKLLNNQIRRLAAMSADARLKDRLLKWAFVLHGESEHYNGGAVTTYDIVRRDNHLFISEDGGKETDVCNHMYANKIYSYSTPVRESDEVDAGRSLLSTSHLENLLDNKWPAEYEFDIARTKTQGKSMEEILGCFKEYISILERVFGAREEYKEIGIHQVVGTFFFDALKAGCAHNRQANEYEVSFVKGASDILDIDEESLLLALQEETTFKDLVMKKVKIGFLVPEAHDGLIGMLGCCVYCDGEVDEADKEYLSFIMPYLS